MKKRLTGLISLIISVFMGMSFLMGCNLVTTDSERDMAQVIATVSIEEGLSSDILKSDLALLYINGGYQNEESQGITREQNMKGLLQNLINQKVILQQAYKLFEADESFAKAEAEAKYTAKRYLSADDVTEADYTVYSSINTIIESYAEAEEGKYQDAFVGDSRPVPNGATNAEKELTIADKQAYVAKGVNYEDTKAISKFIQMLESNGLVGEAYRNSDGDVTKTKYFTQILENEYQQQVINKYEEKLVQEALASITLADLEAQYLELYNSQKEFNAEDFASQLSSASATNPLLYSAYGNYGYVYNLLLGVNSEQETKIAEIRTDNTNISDAEYDQKRAEILAGVTAKDLRSSWIFNGYDSKLEENKLYFTGDYSFIKEGNGYAFQGEVTEITPATEDESAKYAVTELKKFNLTEFVAEMETYLAPTSKTNQFALGKYASLGASNVYSAYSLAGVVNYKEKINELLFAYSTDSGSLNTYQGYVIKPIPEGEKTEEYVKTFADAGRELISIGEDGYVMVASDYGYHVMFYVSAEKPNGTDYPTLTAYLQSLGITDVEAELNDLKVNFSEYENTDTFLYSFCQSVFTSAINKRQNDEMLKLEKDYLYGEKSAVTVFEDRFADMING